MADEVIIEEFKSAGLDDGDTQYRNKSLPKGLNTTQVLDIAVESAAFASGTNWIRIQSKGVGFWYKIGASGVTAAANTNGNSWLPADQFRDIALVAGQTNIDTAA
jgi:hypothetical protein